MSPPPITTTSFTPVDRLRDIRLENILLATGESVYNAMLDTSTGYTGWRVGLVMAWLRLGYI